MNYMYLKLQKILKIGTPKIITISVCKTQQAGFTRLMCPKDADGMEPLTDLKQSSLSL